MRAKAILSVQLYDWPYEINRTLDCLFETQTQPVTQKSPSLKAPPAGLHHQAVQTLRETWMQMHQGTRPRTEVFFIGQLPRRTTKAGIHSQCVPRTSRIMCGRLSPVARDHRGDLQYQLGVVASKRTFVRRHLASRGLIYCPTFRRESGRHIGRQHARNVAHPRVGSAHVIGGKR